jgi:hypothetical protein
VVVYFSGEAALWLQWTNAHLSVSNWEEFVSLVCDKFGRREFEQLLRQFSRLRQTGTVAEYATQLNASMNCLLAHHRSWDPLYFVTQFVDGLRSNIRVVVMVQQPKDLDSAVSLAMLQEEAIELTREATRAGGGHATFPRVIPRTAMPLPPPHVGRNILAITCAAVLCLFTLWRNSCAYWMVRGKRIPHQFFLSLICVSYLKRRRKG